MKQFVFVLLLAPTLLAAEEHQFIIDNDKDGDQKLSWAEAEPTGWSKKMFDIKDMNGDGKISTEDLWTHNEWMKSPAVNPQVIKAMDANDDGLIQRDEWWWGDEFGGFDGNKDGALDKVELAKLPKAKPQRKAKKFKGPPKKG